MEESKTTLEALAMGGCILIHSTGPSKERHVEVSKPSLYTYSLIQSLSYEDSLRLDHIENKCLKNPNLNIGDSSFSALIPNNVMELEFVNTSITKNILNISSNPCNKYVLIR